MGKCGRAGGEANPSHALGEGKLDVKIL